MNFTKNWLCVTKRITSFADVEMPWAMQNLFHVNRIFFKLLEIAWKHFTHNHFLYKTIAIGLLEYQSSGQNSIFTLSIFIKFAYNYSFVGKKINWFTS